MRMWSHGNLFEDSNLSGIGTGVTHFENCLLLILGSFWRSLRNKSATQLVCIDVLQDVHVLSVDEYRVGFHGQ